jgi:hypothetical protein
MGYVPYRCRQCSARYPVRMPEGPDAANYGKAGGAKGANRFR